VVMPLLPTDAGVPEAPPVARATGSLLTVGSIDRAMSQSRDTVQPVCAGGSGDTRSRGAAKSGPIGDDGDCARERHPGKQTLPVPEPIEQGIAVASPAYFGGKLSFGELMVVVGGFYQVNQSLRWFVDNFALLADWRATLSRVVKFREAQLMSESSYEQENRILHLRDCTNHLRLHYDGGSKGKKTALVAGETDLGRSGARSGCRR
jgi:hypothetical protein